MSNYYYDQNLYTAQQSEQYSDQQLTGTISKTSAPVPTSTNFADEPPLLEGMVY